jgi:murein tripeptide amidase MpaA
MTGYVECAIKNNVHPSVLNQKADKEYEKIWEQSCKKNQKAILPHIFMSGQKALATI